MAKRCVNIDWLEVFAAEDDKRYPMNADYFIDRGYIVRTRDYGTRVYNEMFTVCDSDGNPFVEVRRNPASGDSSFSGLSELSCHLRLVNRACYADNPIRDLAQFMLDNGYTLNRIFRLDLCCDFVRFDEGDDPAKFLRRYIENKYSKVNQCKVRAIGSDSWASFDWESVSWGAPKSMVSTKIYNKSKELAATGNKKPWIPYSWFQSGIVDDPLDHPDVWRVEFSMRSTARRWIVIEDVDRRKHRKHAVPHTLEMFDGRYKLWMRFEELAHHYFHFKYVEYQREVDSDGKPILKRKDVCRDKILFRFNLDREFYKIDGLPRENAPDDRVRSLRCNLLRYQHRHGDPDVRRAIDVILDAIDRDRLRDITVHGWASEIDRIRLAIATRTGWSYQRVLEKAEEAISLIKEGEIWL